MTRTVVMIVALMLATQSRRSSLSSPARSHQLAGVACDGEKPGRDFARVVTEVERRPST